MEYRAGCCVPVALDVGVLGRGGLYVLLGVSVDRVWDCLLPRGSLTVKGNRFFLPCVITLQGDVFCDGCGFRTGGTDHVCLCFSMFPV